MNIPSFGILGLYFLSLVLVSLIFRHRLKDLDDFFLAGRSLSTVLVWLTVTASWLGATSTLISIDEAYARGISAFWIMGIPTVLTVLIFAFGLAGPIRSLDILSLPDLVERRYGRTVRHLSAVIIVWYMVVLAASQMVAAGRFLGSRLGLSYLTGLTLAVAIVLLYSLVGGFLSVVLTDGVQFGLLALGFLALFFVLTAESSWDEVGAAAARMDLSGYLNFQTGFRLNFLTAVSFTCAWTISPIIWQRIQAARTVAQARSGLMLSALTFFLYYGLVVFSGMLLLPLISPQLREGQVLAALISGRGGDWLGGLLFLAVAAAVMSTMDTAINTGALSLTKDILFQFSTRARRLSEIRISRAATVAVGLASFAVATRFQSILKTLGLASEIMTEGLFIPGILMLFSKKKRPMAGLLSVSLGGGYSIAGFLAGLGALPFSWPAWPESVPGGMALCAAGYAIGAALDRGRRPRGKSLPDRV